MAAANSKGGVGRSGECSGCSSSKVLSRSINLPGP
jgi:hypothetical protein